MSLTLEQIETLETPGVSWCPEASFSDLCDYARERAAREACEAALREGRLVSDLSLDSQGSEWRAMGWEGSVALACAFAPTPTAAYLALLAALQERVE